MSTTSDRARRWTRVPALIAAAALLVLAAILGRSGVELLSDPPHGLTILGAIALIVAAFVVELACVAACGSRRWAVASSTTGGGIAVVLGSWVQASDAAGAWVVLAIGGISLASAVIIANVDRFGRGDGVTP